jgi:hypothetical protein
MIVWPTSLVREMAARRCVLFLGAGVSASATNSADPTKRPKTWPEFLRDATALVHTLKHQRTIKKLIKEKKFLLALQAIRDESNGADYREQLNRNFNNPSFKEGDLHRCILDLDSRIVITSNFDKIYDRYCTAGESAGAFKVINYYSADLADEIRSDVRLIIKAHGSIDDISKMIFTRAEYHRAKAEHPRFYDILKAIFLTHTAIFIGCSMEDPDVLLLLEDVKITASAEKPHYVLSRKGTQDFFSISDWRKTYNIWPLEYGPTHANLVEDLRALQYLVDLDRATTGAI